MDFASLKAVFLLIIGVIACSSGQSLANPYTSLPNWESADTQVSTGAALADLDRDGWLDLVVANGNDIHSQRVVVYYNRADGTFPASPDWQSSDLGYHGHLDIADVNGDGWLDVAVSLLLNQGGPSAKVYLNRSGTLSYLPDWTCTETDRTFGVAFGDVNNDGRPDLAVGTGWPYGAGYEAPMAVHLNVDGELDPDPTWVSGDDEHLMGVLWVDGDDDGWLDLLGVGAGTYSWIYPNTGGTLSTLATWHTSDVFNQFAIMAAAGDLTGDGQVDLVITDNTQVGDGSGLFRQYTGLSSPEMFTTLPQWTYFDGYGSAVALADVNADGKLDLATGAWWKPARVFLNNGSGLPETPSWSSTQTSVIEKIYFGDINKDGLRRKLQTFSPDGDRRFWMLDHQPIDRILSVRVDEVEMKPSEFVLHREHGWISVSVTPQSEVTVDYLYSLKPDIAISNWDSAKGNYVYYHTLEVDADFDADGDVDGDDFAAMSACLAGPSAIPSGSRCEVFDFDLDLDVDLADFLTFQDAAADR